MSLTQISPGNVERYLNHKFVEATVPIIVSESASQKGIENVAAEGISYYTPAQIPPSGTAIIPQPTGLSIPKLFTPLSLRNLTLPHRIILSPLCQYSAPPTGHQTSWHFAHLGGIISRGPGLTILEATAVLPNGRITPQDCGLWTDSQKEPLRNIVEFAHSQGQKIALQLNHAGRKSSTVAPWLSFAATASKDVGGWPDDVWAPSAVRHCEGYPQPKALSLEGIEEIKDAFAKAVHWALDVSFDAIEIHAAHGYLLHQFMSPVSNHRTDMYGGSFENRIRLLLEVVDATRKAMQDSMPLFLRISATDWLDKNPDFQGDSWTLSDTLRLAPILAAHGVDLLDISSSGISPLQKITTGPGYQAPFSKAIKSVLGPNSSMKVAAVGSISSGAQAEAILTGKGEGSQGEEELDLVFVGRPFLKNPSLVWSWAEELGTRVNVASQIRWPFVGRPGVGMCKEGKAGK